MLFNHSTFIGIDPTAGHKPFTYAALDNDLRLLALGSGSMEDMLAFTGGQRQAVVAVSAPRRPNLGVMERPEVRRELNPPPRPGRWGNFRLSEYLLRQRNITGLKTPFKEEECPGWMKMGFTFYNRLEGAGYCPYPTVEAALQWVEVYPYACYFQLLGRIPFPKYTLEGRIQRQLVLYEQGLHVPDPMDFFEEITRHRLLQGRLPEGNLYSSAELDALVAAYTAWKAALHPKEVLCLGDPIEGQIVLPCGEQPCQNTM